MDHPIILEVDWTGSVFHISITSEGATHHQDMAESKYRLFCDQSQTIINFGGKAFFFRGRSGTVTIRTRRGMVDYFQSRLRDFDATNR